MFPCITMYFALLCTWCNFLHPFHSDETAVGGWAILIMYDCIEHGIFPKYELLHSRSHFSSFHSFFLSYFDYIIATNKHGARCVYRSVKRWLLCVDGECENETGKEIIYDQATRTCTYLMGLFVPHFPFLISHDCIVQNRYFLTLSLNSIVKNEDRFCGL